MLRHRWQPPSAVIARRATGDVHPGQDVYILVAVILAVLTAIEVMVYYIDAIRQILIPILIALAAVKFSLVAGWFMHLRFDSAFFTALFLGGLALALSVYLVVLAASRIFFV